MFNWLRITKREAVAFGFCAILASIICGMVFHRAINDAQLIAPIISAISAVVASIGALIAYSNLRSNRAWMMPLVVQNECFIEHPENLDLPGEKRICLRQGWVNGGKSPAIHFRHKFRVATVQAGAPVPDFSPEIEGDSRALVGPNQEKSGTWIEITDARAVGVLRGELDLYVYSLCYYNDIYSGAVRESHACTRVRVEIVLGYVGNIRARLTPMGPLNYAT